MSVDAKATFAIDLQDGTSSPAEHAAAELEKLKEKIQGDVQKLRDLQGALRNLKGPAGLATAATKKVKEEIAATKIALQASQAKFINLGGGLKTLGQKAEAAAAGGFEHLLSASKRLPGPLGGLARQLEDVSKLVSGGGALAAGSLIAAAAVAVLAIGLAAGAAALLSYGLAQSSARRAELQSLGGHEDMQKTIDRVSDSSVLGRAQILGLAQSLRTAGVSAANFDVALDRAVTRATKHLGHGKEALIDLDVQTSKLHERVGLIFSGLRIESFLRGLYQVTSLFSQNTATGRALKEIVETLFNPMLDALGTLGPLARSFFQGIVIASLRILLAIDDVRLAFKRAFGSTDILGGIDAQNLALYAGEAVIFTLAAGAGILALALAAVVVTAATLAAPFLLAAAAGAALLYGLSQLVDYVSQFQGVFREAGNSMWKGLVNGLHDGMAAVRSAVVEVASAAREALQDALGIHSPSRVFAELGVQIPRGLAEGIESGASGVSGASESLASAAVGGATSSSSSSVTQHISIVVQAPQGSEPRAFAVAIRDELATLLEGVSIEVGSQ